jgi:hypothetical protein
LVALDSAVLRAMMRVWEALEETGEVGAVHLEAARAAAVPLADGKQPRPGNN